MSAGAAGWWRSDRGERVAVAVGLGWVALVGAVVAVVSGSLGHDEAQYALGARGLVDGAADADPYPLHRSIGMRLLAAPGVVAGGSELAIRLPFVLVAMVYAALVWRLARRAGAASGLLALAVQVTAAPWLMRSGEALSDLPAAALVLAMVVLMTDDAARPRPRVGAWLGAAVAGAAAIYLRYGSGPLVALVLATVMVVYRRRRVATFLTGVGVALLLVPFFLWSEARTGSLLGVLQVSELAANRAYVGDGLVWYATRWPWAVAGPLMGAVAAVGVAVGISAWRPGRATAADAEAASARLRRVLVVSALGQIILLGLRAHGEARYVFFATTALTVAGAGWIAIRPRLRAAVLVLSAISAVGGAAVAISRSDRMAWRRVALVGAAAAVRVDADGQRCLVFTGTRPQISWYTGCRTELVGGEPVVAETATGFDRVYLLSADRAPWQPRDGAALSAPGLTFRPWRCGEAPTWCVWRAR